MSDTSVNAKFELASLKSRDAVTSELPILQKFAPDNPTTLELKAKMFEKLQEYLEVYFPGTNAEAVSVEFINLLFVEFYTLNPIDFFAFLNFVKLNKPNNYGHKISPLELVESLRSYLADRAEQTEQLHHNRKFKTDNTEVKSDNPLKQILERLKQKSDARQQAEQEESDNRIKLHREKNQKWDELLAKHFPTGIPESDTIGDIAAQEFVNEWNEFLKSIKPNQNQ